MGRYYAIVIDGHIQVDVNTGQLEIYEVFYEAKTNLVSGASVVEVEVQRSATLTTTTGAE